MRALMLGRSGFLLEGRTREFAFGDAKFSVFHAVQPVCSTLAREARFLARRTGHASINFRVLFQLIKA